MAARATPSLSVRGGIPTRPSTSHRRGRGASRIPLRASTSPATFADVDRAADDDDDDDENESSSRRRKQLYRELSAPPAWAAESDNPPLRGNFAPVVGECTLDDLVVDGVLPPGLDGVYLRNGPNPAHEPMLGARRYHWFDGDGMVHWIRLNSSGDGTSKNGSASYGRRYVRTRGFAQEEKCGRALYTGLRDINPIWSVLVPRLFAKLAKWRDPDSPFWVIQSKNTANNGVKYHAGRLLATYESGSAYELELGPGLSTLGLCDFCNTFNTKDYWLDNMTAHGKTDPNTGEMVYIGYNLIDVNGDGVTDVTVGVIDANGARSHRTTVPVARPSMQHDVGITATRTVLLDAPLVFDLARVMEGGLPFGFEGDQSARIGVMPRFGEGAEEVVWIDTGEPCFCYHVVNCFDDPGCSNNNRVVIDVCKADATNALGMAKGFEGGVSGYGDDVSFFNADAVGESDFGFAGEYISNHPNAVGHGRDVATLWRWVVDVDSKALVSSERMCETPSDFPCVSPKKVGLEHRFCYTVAYKPGTEPVDRMDVPSFDRVLKHDLRTGEVHEFALGEGRACGDIVFVPNDEEKRKSECDDDDEDDGHLLVLTHVLAEDRAELLVLGRDERTGGLARVATVRVPVRVPFGFHNEFVPGSELRGVW